jgi:hypothetical protein
MFAPGQDDVLNSAPEAAGLAAVQAAKPPKPAAKSGKQAAIAKAALKPQTKPAAKPRAKGPAKSPSAALAAAKAPRPAQDDDDAPPDASNVGEGPPGPPRGSEKEDASQNSDKFEAGRRVAVTSTAPDFEDGPPRRGVVVKARGDGTFLVAVGDGDAGPRETAGPESLTLENSSEDLDKGDKVVVTRTGRTGTIASISGAQWYRVVMDDTRGTPEHDDHGENFRPSQIRKRGLVSAPAAIKKGARVLIQTDAPSRLVTAAGQPPRIGRGTIVDVKTGGWRLVQYDEGTGRASDSVRVARLVALVPAGAVAAPTGEAPPRYQKITKMRVHTTARRALDRAAARAAPDETSGMKCVCWARKVWDSKVDKLLQGTILTLPGRAGPLRIKRAGESINEQKRRFLRDKSQGVDCDAQCLNRAQSIECIPQTCGLKGGNCANRRFASGRGAKVDVRKNGGGWGLFVAEPLKKRDFVIEALGELVDKEEAQDRFAKTKGSEAYLLAASSLGLVIDASKSGNAARFAAHAREPNCALETWRCGAADKYGLFSLRDIGEGEELCYDHGWLRQLTQPASSGRTGPGSAVRKSSGALGGDDTDDNEETGVAPRPFQEEDEQLCDTCHTPHEELAACKACKKKLCYPCAVTTAEEYEEASPWYCSGCHS